MRYCSISSDRGRRLAGNLLGALERPIVVVMNSMTDRRVLGGLVLALFVSACVASTGAESTVASTPMTRPAADSTSTASATSMTVATASVPVESSWEFEPLAIERPDDVVIVEDTQLEWPAPELHTFARFDGTWFAAGEANERFAIWRSSDGVEWSVVFHEPHTRKGVEGRISRASRIVRLGDRLMAFASVMLSPRSDRPNLSPVTIAWASDDGGSTWRRAADSGGLDDTAATVATAAATPGGSVAVGDIRPSEPDSGPVLPAVWVSDDAETWTLVSDGQAAFAGDGGIADVAWFGNALYAVGQLDFEMAMWRSDAGLEWERLDVDAFGPGALRSITEWQGRLLVFGDSWPTAGSSFLWTSDDGATWEPAPYPSGLFGSGSERRHWSMSIWNDQILVAARSHERPGPDHCYLDAETCDQHATILGVSDDLVTWRRVVMDEQFASGAFVKIETSDEGPVIYATMRSAETATPAQVVWRHRGSETTLATTDLEPDTIPGMGVPLLPFDVDQIEVGVTWRRPVSIAGCGAGLKMNDTYWTPPQDFDVIPDDWPVRPEGDSIHRSWILYGTITLTTEDEIEIRHPSTGELLLTLIPTDEPPPICF